MDLDESALRALAGRAGLPLQFVYKEGKLFEALSKILGANREAGYDIVLKGGTALNKVYFKGAQRFSEDIDFDIFTKGARLEKLVRIEGFSLEGPWKAGSTVRYHLKYDFFGKGDNIRVEFSLGKARKTLNPVSGESMGSDVVGSAIYGVPCYSFDDLVARKMNALRTRAEGKDVWDCYHALPKTVNLRGAMGFAIRSEGLGIGVDKALDDTVEKLKKADPKELMKLTNPYIPTSIRPKDWKEIIDALMEGIGRMRKR